MVFIKNRNFNYFFFITLQPLKCYLMGKKLVLGLLLLNHLTDQKKIFFSQRYTTFCLDEKTTYKYIYIHILI
jgi:hypothetical protein